MINSGIEFNGDPIQYTYSDLPSLKHNLIEKASQDAKERAEKIVNTASGDLGKLKKRIDGCVPDHQVRDQLRKIAMVETMIPLVKEKTARITVRLTYTLD
jgi:hypothetical protein